MSDPPQSAISLWRGNNDPREWAFGPEDDPDDLTGYAFELVITWPAASGADPAHPAGSLSASTAAGTLLVDLTLGQVTWPYTVDDVAAIPRGARPVYELKRIIGALIVTVVWGAVKVSSPQGG